MTCERCGKSHDACAVSWCGALDHLDEERQGGQVSQPARQATVTPRSTLGVLPGPEKPTTIEELHEAAGRLHACAWHGRKSVGEASRARFSIPRQPTDDDNLIYAAIEELRALRAALHKGFAQPKGEP